MRDAHAVGHVSIDFGGVLAADKTFFIAVTLPNPLQCSPPKAASPTLAGSSPTALMPPATTTSTPSATSPPVTTAFPMASMPLANSPLASTLLTAPPHLDEGSQGMPRLRGEASGAASTCTHSPPPSPTRLQSATHASPARRGLIFSPLVRADHVSAMAELHYLSFTPSTPGGAAATGASTPPSSSPSFEGAEAEVQPSRSSSPSSPSSTPPHGGTGTVAVADFTPTPLRRSGRHSVGVDSTT